MTFRLDDPAQKHISSIIYKSAEAAFRGREMIAPEPIPYGKTTHEYHTLTRPGAPNFGVQGMTIYYDATAKSRTITPLIKIAQGFALTKEQLASQPSIVDSEAFETGYQISKSLDELIQIGYTDVDATQIVSGLYNTATPTQAAANTWGSASATPYEDVNAGLAQMEAQGIEGDMFLALTATNRGEARRTNSLGLQAWTQMKDNLNMTDMILSDKLTANTGMIVKKDPKYAVLAIAEDLTVEAPNYMYPTQSWAWNVTMTCVPIGKEAYSVCTLTSL